MSNEELTVLINQGRAELLSVLWEQTRALLFCIMKRCASEYDYESRGYTLEDLEQECYIVLCEAVKSYNPDKNYKLSTYFSFCTKNHLNAIIGNRIKSIGLDLLNGAESLNKTISDNDESLTLADIIADETNDYEHVDDTVFNDELHNALEKALNDLEQMQRDCIKLHFYGNRSVTETGKYFNISQGKARQHINKGIKHLRRNKELRKHREEILTARAYNHIGIESFFHKGSIEERLIEMLDTPQADYKNGRQ